MGETLKVPGATLYYETSGSGPLLLFIGGGTSDTSHYDLVRGHFEDRHTVVRYDRRGNSRSLLDGEPHPQRIEVHGDDAAALVEHLGRGPADVFGSSSGALVAVDLVARRPDLLRRAVAHEAPAFTLTPERAENLAFLRVALAEFERGGVAAGMAVFANGSGPAEDDPDSPPEARAAAARIAANGAFFFRHEMMSFVDYEPDLAALAANSAHLFPAVGEDSVDTPPTRATTILAEKTGTGVSVFPGGHVGYLSHARQWARRLDEMLHA
ncbi:alpha/beta fold hydrolase [Actinokineospora pegani]|uniref:alpha/beta fold hydrolase n=1 Tax=Actinokineospora pegani TaxID=2654637 RepID=UPI0012EA1B1E|nr:alpha/beta hydrolase [Actinokineospora pegani]